MPRGWASRCGCREHHLRAACLAAAQNSTAYRACEKVSMSVFCHTLVYNSVSRIRMDLVLFTTFIQHVCRVQRVLKLPMGNALLVGVGVSGRKSTMMMLSTYVAQFELFQIEISKGYGMDEGHDDMKRLFMRCGCDDMSVTFLVCYTVVVANWVNWVILNTGEVPNLYTTNEDRLEINKRCSKAASAILSFLPSFLPSSFLLPPSSFLLLPSSFLPSVLRLPSFLSLAQESSLLTAMPWVALGRCRVWALARPLQ